jgi:cytochrome o ubiquinol oxidase subunit 1
MIFFLAMAFMTGLFNFIVPLQIGARDVAFPFLNNLSFWMTAVAFILVNISLFVGEFSQCGWLAYPPLSETQFSPGVGVDYYIWAIQISGVGTLLTGMNFFVTIVKMRAPGMSWMKMPVFTWTAFCSSILIMVSFPVLTVAVALLGLDRYFGMHFFTNDGGGNQMMYLNLIWAWGHPEVYILVICRLWCVLRSCACLLWQAPVRLQHHGLCNLLHHGAVLPRVGASLLHHGRWPGRQCLLRYCDHDHRDPDWC